MTTNERLRTAIHAAGLTIDQLGEDVGVDPKTVERWISTDRVPHRAHRQAVATALGKDDVFLWPTTLSAARTKTASEAEFVAIHANRGAVPPGTWDALLHQPKESIDILAYAASFLYDTIPEFTRLLTDRANEGIRVRLLFGDPGSQAVLRRGEEERIGDSLASRTALTWKYIAPLTTTPGLDARKHGTTLYDSVFRYDDEMLVNLHSYGAAGAQCPYIHLHRVAGGRMFAHYMEAFERVWEGGEPV